MRLTSKNSLAKIAISFHKVPWFSLCLGKFPKFPGFSLTGTVVCHFPAFPVHLGTLGEQGFQGDEQLPLITPYITRVDTYSRPDLLSVRHSGTGSLVSFKSPLPGIVYGRTVYQPFRHNVLMKDGLPCRETLRAPCSHNPQNSFIVNAYLLHCGPVISFCELSIIPHFIQWGISTVYMYLWLKEKGNCMVHPSYRAHEASFIAVILGHLYLFLISNVCNV